MAGARTRWGWHRLDERWAEWLVAEARLPTGATVVDVGAGTGAITGALVRRHLRVIAVQAHERRAAALRQRFGDDIVVVRADGADLRLPRCPYHVVANPPFAITSALLRRLLQPGSRLVSAHLVLQDQAARRWCGPHAPAAARWWRDFAVELGPAVPRRAFSPPPRTSARILVIEQRKAR